MIFIIYFTIGLLYWGLNSFVRKLEIDGDWLLPLIWFVAWPLPVIALILVGLEKVVAYLMTKDFRKHF